MIDYVLKFPSEAVSVDLASSAGLVQPTDDDGKSELVRFTSQYGIFVQGVITQPAVTDPNGAVLTPAKTLEGWWVRVRILDDSTMPAAFEPFITDERPDGLWSIA